MILGFSTGVLYKTDIDRISNEAAQFFNKLGCNTIEFMCYDHKNINNLDSLDKNILDKFAYKTIHGPISLADIPKKQQSLYINKLEIIYKKLSFNAVIFHSDNVDIDLLKNVKFQVLIENNDHRYKDKSVAELKTLFDKYPQFNMVLDINHCYTNDKTLKLADDMINAFSDRIKEIHISGFRELHEPIIETKQTFFLDYLKLPVPVIIESVFDKIDDVEKEFRLIKDYNKN